METTSSSHSAASLEEETSQVAPPLDSTNNETVITADGEIVELGTGIVLGYLNERPYLGLIEDMGIAIGRISLTAEEKEVIKMLRRGGFKESLDAHRNLSKDERKRRFNTPEAKARLSKAGKAASPLAISAAMKRQWDDPNSYRNSPKYRERLSNTQRERGAWCKLRYALTVLYENLNE